MTNTTTLVLKLLQAMQADMLSYLVPDSNISDHEFCNLMIGHLDGPQQREAQAALVAEAAQPPVWPVRQ